METPGVTAKTIPALHSEHDFHETTFDNVHLPASSRLGEEGKGWDVVTAALHHERVGAAHYEMMQRALDRAVQILKERGQFNDPMVKARAASVWAATEAARVLTYKVVDQRVRKLPSSAMTSIVRVSMIRSNHDFANFVSTFLPDVPVHGPTMDGRVMLAFKWALGSGMASGAAEVQLNLISGRHLHLPKEG
jgi:alkylation response protein AidB-like acyl-CoA dehydrogenase